MKKFYVKVTEAYTYDLAVMAENEDDARRKAEECINNDEQEDGTPLPESQYDYTIDSDDWSVHAAS